ncbi:MAG: hypothetical protein ACO3OX_07875 [Burkholderiaceae bacterium]
MKHLFTAAAALLVALPASAAIVICPQNGRPYDTTHGYYVDVPGTRYYVPNAKARAFVRRANRQQQPVVRPYGYR